MIDGLIKEFKELYVAVLEGRGGDSERERLLSLIKLIENGNGVASLMEYMDDMFVRTQKFQYSLIGNRIRLNEHVFYTRYKNYFYLIDVTGKNADGTSGVVRVANLDLTRVIIDNGDIFIQDNRAPERWTHKLYCSQTDRFDFEGMPKKLFSTGYSNKGHGNYRSIVRAHGDEKRINHRIHVIIYGVVHGFSSLLASGSVAFFEVHHINDDNMENGIENLELQTHIGNLQCSVDAKKKKVHDFLERHFGYLDGQTA